MADFLSDAYPWIKALHVIAVIAWMAGLLYLPRLFVYHADAQPGSPQSETFKVMERRLLRAIMTPAMAAAWLFGLLLLSVPGVASFSDGWVYAKLFLVVLMSAAHGKMGRWQRDFETDANHRPARFYRLANEIPTLLMIGIVILVIVKPF
jgi:putative membrane protein